jgi:hypothetical protein
MSSSKTTSEKRTRFADVYPVEALCFDGYEVLEQGIITDDRVGPRFEGSGHSGIVDGRGGQPLHVPKRTWNQLEASGDVSHESVDEGILERRPGQASHLPPGEQREHLLEEHRRDDPGETNTFEGQLHDRERRRGPRAQKPSHQNAWVDHNPRDPRGASRLRRRTFCLVCPNRSTEDERPAQPGHLIGNDAVAFSCPAAPVQGRGAPRVVQSPQRPRRALAFRFVSPRIFLNAACTARPTAAERSSRGSRARTS